MKRILSCGLIIALAVALSLPAVANTKEEETRYAEELRKAKEAGFIALSETEMNWKDAKAFCQQMGGKLPRVNNDDFDEIGRPWSEVGLPSDRYWSGTELSPGRSWVVLVRGGGIYVTYDRPQSYDYRVVCVP